MKTLVTVLLVLVIIAHAGVLRAADARRNVVFCTASEYVTYPGIGTEEFGIGADGFCLSPDEAHGRASVEGFDQALAKSSLLVISPQQDRVFPNVDLIFADRANREAVKGFLKAGGTLVLDNTRIDPKGELETFLAEVDVALPKPGRLPKLEKRERHTAVGARDAAGARHPLASAPNALDKDFNPGISSAYGSWSAKQVAPLRCFQEPEAGVLVVQDRVLGAGRVIFNKTGVFSASKTGAARLAENLYTYALGTTIRRVARPPQRYKVKEGWQIWGKNPYGPFPLESDAPERAAVDKVNISAAVNERLSAQVLVTIAEAGPEMKLAIECGELRSVDGALPPVVVRELVFDQPQGMYPDPLPETKGFTLAPGETRVVWLTVDTYDARPGEYRGELTLTPEGGAARKLPITVRVLPIMLPVDNPLRFTTWELFFSWRDKLVEDPANWTFFHQDMIDHGVNVFHVTSGMPPRTIDDAGKVVLPPDALAKFRARFMTLDKTSMYLIYGNIEKPFSHGKGRTATELTFPSAEQTQAYKSYVAEILKLLKELGLGYDQFAFYPYDEIPATKVESALATCAAIKEVDPRAKVFVNLGGHSLAEFFETEKGRPVKELAPYVDIWVPGIGFYKYFGNPGSVSARRLAKVVDFCKQTGKQVWSYNVTTRSSYDLAPYQRYRLKPWGAYALGLTGYGFYGVNLWKNDTFTAFYPGPRPIPSIRWEAVREGMNDVKYMVVLKEEIARAKQAGRPTAAAEELLAHALAEVNRASLDASLAPAYRERIAAMILELRK